jgi:hypothetical protein
MQAPLQMVAFDDDCTGNLAVHLSLKLWSDVDQHRAVLDRLANVVRFETDQTGAGSRKKAIKSVPSVVPGIVHVISDW